MLSAVHTVTSLPFAIYLGNIPAILIAAFLWHFLADSILHWNIDPNKPDSYPYFFVSLDVIGGLVVAYFLLGPAMFTPRFLAAIIGGNLPDVIHTVWYLLPPNKRQHWFGWAKWWFDFHHRVQNETKNILAGLATQALAVITAIYLILK
ncbi:MAG: hypothetical protein U1C49_00080 [Candidatus Andersenbacteria bacterium]|nr:hypothetical protein [bacterium]MDZ4225222.1 hypothetical protein [Candidatus Andersenbacteria bacterium]